MTNRNPDERLDDLLHDLGPADPPAGFSREVLSKIEGDHNRVAKHVLPFSQRKVAITKTAMWGLAAAAAVILVVFVARGFPRVDQGTEGAIGAAKKDPAEQIASDVKLGDASAQEFMQSDTFARLLKDPAAVKALSDANLRQQVADSEMRKALTDPDLAAALRRYGPTGCRGNCQLLAGDAQFQALLHNVAFARALADANLRAAIESDAFQRALRSNGFDAALRSTRFAEAMASSASGVAR